MQAQGPSRGLSVLPLVVPPRKVSTTQRQYESGDGEFSPIINLYRLADSYCAIGGPDCESFCYSPPSAIPYLSQCRPGVIRIPHGQPTHGIPLRRGNRPPFSNCSYIRGSLLGRFPPQRLRCSLSLPTFLITKDARVVPAAPLTTRRLVRMRRSMPRYHALTAYWVFLRAAATHNEQTAAGNPARFRIRQLEPSH